jgi:hypothetical protein
MTKLGTVDEPSVVVGDRRSLGLFVPLAETVYLILALIGRMPIRPSVIRKSQILSLCISFPLAGQVLNCGRVPRRPNQSIDNILYVGWTKLKRKHIGPARKLVWISQKFSQQGWCPIPIFCLARRADEYEKESDAIGRLSRLLSDGAN